MTRHGFYRRCPYAHFLVGVAACSAGGSAAAFAGAVALLCIRKLLRHLQMLLQARQGFRSKGAHLGIFGIAGGVLTEPAHK